jgi:hypothetical protein
MEYDLDSSPVLPCPLNADVAQFAVDVLFGGDFAGMQRGVNIDSKRFVGNVILHSF